MKHRAILIGAVLLASVAWSVAGAAPTTASASSATRAKESIGVSARLEENSKEGVILCLELINNSGEQIAIPAGNLPWNWSGAITLAIIDGAPINESLPLTRPIEDPPIGKVVLSPGEKLSGEIVLDRYFAGLQTARRRGKLILFWHWTVTDQDNRSQVQQGGWLTVAPASK